MIFKMTINSYVILTVATIYSFNTCACVEEIKVQVPNNTTVDSNKELTGRVLDQQLFIKDLIDRLHRLDDDISKVAFFNNTVMYNSPTAAELAYEEANKGGEKFSEVLADLDSLNDEIANMAKNATRTRQYNILVRLRPLNTILYRIRHNMHLIRNSLVAVNTVAGLEKVGNSIMDNTLQVFTRPDSNNMDELKEPERLDIDLDKPEDIRQPESTPQPAIRAESSTSKPTSTSAPATTTTTRTTPKPPRPTVARATSTTTTTTSTAATTTQPTTTTSVALSSSTRRRNNRRRTTTTTTTTSTKPIPDAPIASSQHQGNFRSRTSTNKPPLSLHDTPLSSYDSSTRRPRPARPALENAPEEPLNS